MRFIAFSWCIERKEEGGENLRKFYRAVAFFVSMKYFQIVKDHFISLAFNSQIFSFLYLYENVSIKSGTIFVELFYQWHSQNIHNKVICRNSKCDVWVSFPRYIMFCNKTSIFFNFSSLSLFSLLSNIPSILHILSLHRGPILNSLYDITSNTWKEIKIVDEKNRRKLAYWTAVVEDSSYPQRLRENERKREERGWWGGEKDA